MQKSESIKNIAAALTKAQSSMGGAVKDKNNPFFKSKYADLSSVIRTIKEAFAENGLSYSQFPINEDDKIGVRTTLMHSSGEFITDSFVVKVGGKGDPQAAGSAITYARRYALQAIAGIPSDDDDGNAASKKVVKKAAKNMADNMKGMMKEDLEKPEPSNDDLKEFHEAMVNDGLWDYLDNKETNALKENPTFDEMNALRKKAEELKLNDKDRS